MNETDTSILIGVCVWAAIAIAIPWLWCFIAACRSGECIDEDDFLLLFAASIFWPITAAVLLIFTLCALVIWAIKSIPIFMLLSLPFRPVALGRIVWRLRKKNKKGAK